MKYITKTICEKIRLVTELVEKAVETKKFNAVEMVTILRDARRDAQAMEDGLKARKEYMTKIGVEEAYQKHQLAQPRSTFIDEQLTVKDPDYHVVVTDKTGKVLIDKQTHAFILNIVDNLKGFDKDGAILGTTSPLAVGNELSLFFAHDQLTKALKPKLTSVVVKIMEAIETGIITNPEVIKHVKMSFRR